MNRQVPVLGSTQKNKAGKWSCDCIAKHTLNTMLKFGDDLYVSAVVDRATKFKNTWTLHSDHITRSTYQTLSKKSILSTLMMILAGTQYTAETGL